MNEYFHKILDSAGMEVVMSAKRAFFTLAQSFSLFTMLILKEFILATERGRHQILMQSFTTVFTWSLA